MSGWWRASRRVSRAHCCVDLITTAAERTLIIVTGNPGEECVPVTAKLSRDFYERFGDKLANELVEWFNLVDATYRSDLRELNDLNFARFDAKLEQRLAELDAKWERRSAQLDAQWERWFAEIRSDMEAGFARADARLEQRLAEVKAELADRLGALESRLSHRLLGFWIAQAATTVGLVFGVVKLLQR